MLLYILQFIIMICSLVVYGLLNKPEWLVFAGIILMSIILEEILDEMREDVVYVPDDKWVATADALPPEPGYGKYVEYNVIEPDKSEVTTLAYIGSGVWISPLSGDVHDDVTHWQPLPEKENKNE